MLTRIIKMLINNNKDTPIEWKKVPKPLLILLPTD